MNKVMYVLTVELLTRRHETMGIQRQNETKRTVETRKQTDKDTRTLGH